MATRPGVDYHGAGHSLKSGQFQCPALMLRAGVRSCFHWRRRLDGLIQTPEMVAVTAAVRMDGIPEVIAAGNFLNRELGLQLTLPAMTHVDQLLRIGRRLAKTTAEHLFLVAVSLSLAALFCYSLLPIVRNTSGSRRLPSSKSARRRSAPLIGAGGDGAPILTGIRLSSTPLILGHQAVSTVLPPPLAPPLPKSSTHRIFRCIANSLPICRLVAISVFCL
ncbi:MAG: hypothetical protein U0795_06085 [Pirellulales bacterium]